MEVTQHVAARGQPYPVVLDKSLSAPKVQVPKNHILPKTQTLTYQINDPRHKYRIIGSVERRQAHKQSLHPKP